jgi:polysaccharide export outer membrane protein
LRFLSKEQVRGGSRKEEDPLRRPQRKSLCGFLALILVLFTPLVHAQDVEKDDQPPYSGAQKVVKDETVPPSTPSTKETGTPNVPDAVENLSPEIPDVAPPSSDVMGNNETNQATTRRRKTPPTDVIKRASRTELTDFQRLVESSLGYTLPIYGETLFEEVPTTFAPADRVPVTANYVIGPGDELLIRAWGQIDLDIHTRVERNGNIYVPKVGNLTVAGLKYEQIEDFLKSHIGRIYQNFDLNVTLGELRSIDVYVVGQARRPGRYTVSSLSTLANAIFACGGPSPTGSMRTIQLKRGSQVITQFDLYDLLLMGDKGKDVLLLPEDVIYFPPIGSQVAMGGEVNVPAIYELKSEASLGDVFHLAGGLSTTASGDKILVEHIHDHKDRSIEQLPLGATGMAHPLKDGDVVNVIPLSPRFQNSVTLRGNVAVPGRYPWHEGMRVNDLIPNRQFLITRKYWQQQNAVALQASISEGRVSASQNDVKRNAPEINWDYAVVQRMSQRDLSTQLLPFNLGKAVLEHDEANNLALQTGDIVTIFSQADLRVPQAQQTKLVRLEGEFASAGTYRAQSGEKLRDLVQQAGGLTPSAYLYGAVFTRESTRQVQQERLDVFISEAERDNARRAAEVSRNARTGSEVAAAHAALEIQQEKLEKLRQFRAEGRIVLNLHPNDDTVDALPDLSVEDGDQLYVPSRPAVVSVIGDVYNQGSFLQQSGKTVASYLQNAGGTTRDADKGRIFVVRANGVVVSKDAGSRFWSGGFDSMVLTPGDTILVPEQLNKGGFIRGVKDWSQVLANFGLTAAAINVLR